MSYLNRLKLATGVYLFLAILGSSIPACDRDQASILAFEEIKAQASYATRNILYVMRGEHLPPR